MAWNYLAVTKQLVPFLSAKLAHSIVLGGQSIMPHQAVRRVLNTGAHHVVGVDISEPLQRLTQRWFFESVYGSTCLPRRSKYIQAVPVRPTPRPRTFMGTVRWHLRRSIQVSSVKMSVHGWGERLSAWIRDIVDAGDFRIRMQLRH